MLYMMAKPAGTDYPHRFDARFEPGSEWVSWASRLFSGNMAIIIPIIVVIAIVIGIVLC